MGRARERPEGETGIEIPGMVEAGTRARESRGGKGATGASGLIMRKMQKYIDQMEAGQEEENPLQGASSGQGGGGAAVRTAAAGRIKAAEEAENPQKKQQVEEPQSQSKVESLNQGEKEELFGLYSSSQANTKGRNHPGKGFNFRQKLHDRAYKQGPQLGVILHMGKGAATKNLSMMAKAGVQEK